MQIAFLDSSTLHGGELDLSPLESCGSLICYQTTTPEEVDARIADADIVLTNKVVLSAESIAKASKLRLIVSCATGVNQIDLKAAQSHEVCVSNVAGYSTDAVAQHVFGMLINLATGMHQLAREKHAWPESPIFTRLDYPGFELRGKTMGIVGLGAIGRAVATLAQAFGMNVQALARDGNLANSGEIPRLPAELFFASSDVISLHCPLNEMTAGMIRLETLQQMKPTALLINTGRGPLVCEADLAEALREGVIAGAGLDVLSTEPPQPDNPLIKLDHPNLLITPHTAWSPIEARRRLLDGIVTNIKSFLAGDPTNRII